MQRLIDAALELMSNPDAGDLTVQNVAERAGLSLRAFYHHFPSKDDLLLAVFEEAIQTTARSLDQEVAASADPLERLRIFTIEYYRTCRTGRTEHSDQRLPGRNLGQFAYQLLFDHPEEAAHAFAPLVSSLRRLLDDAAAAGAIRSGGDHEQVAGIVLQSIMFNGFATTITGSTTDDYAGGATCSGNSSLTGWRARSGPTDREEPDQPSRSRSPRVLHSRLASRGSCGGAMSGARPSAS